MNHELIFSAVGITAFIGWGALALAPRNRTFTVTIARCVSLLLAIGYGAMFALSWGEGAGMDFNSLAGVTRTLSSPGHMLAGWIHYLAFDLFIGAWETEEAAKLGMPHFVLLPCLALTFIFGPLGLLAFMGARYFWTIQVRDA